MAQNSPESMSAFRAAYQADVEAELALFKSAAERMSWGLPPAPKRNVFQRAVRRARWRIRDAREWVALRLAPWLEPY